MKNWIIFTAFINQLGYSIYGNQDDFCIEKQVKKNMFTSHTITIFKRYKHSSNFSLFGLPKTNLAIVKVYNEIFETNFDYTFVDDTPEIRWMPILNMR